MIGQRFGKLIIQSRAAPRPPDKHAQWNATCDCGGTVVVSTSQVKHKGYKSCGCLKGTGNLKHGMAGTRTYKVWTYMLSRCSETNINKKDYFERGITVCERWLKFENFLADMGEAPDGLTLDREDNDKGYHKENCRWATWEEQARNTRRNRYIETPQGRMLMIDAVRISNLPYSTIQWRLNNNWPTERLFEAP
jgi:hypothetical protein